MVKSFEERLKETKLTKKGLVIAQYILDNKDTAAFSTATALAQKLNISDVTIIRMARLLGYTNYSDMQRSLQEDISNKLQNQSTHFPSLGERMFNQYGEDYDDLIHATAQNCIRNIDDCLSKLSSTQIEETAKRLIMSEHCFIVGFWSASILAEHFMIKYNLHTKNVHLINKLSPETLIPMCSISPKDCAVIFSYGRYPEMSVTLAKLAKDNGACVILITDKETSPLTKYSDFSFFADITSMAFSSQVAPLLLSEIILTKAVKMVWSERKNHYDQSEELLKKMQFFHKY